MTVCGELSPQVLYETSGSLYTTLLLELQRGAHFSKVLQNFQAHKAI